MREGQNVPIKMSRKTNRSREDVEVAADQDEQSTRSHLTDVERLK